MLASIGYAVAYTGVGLALLALGFLALDLLTPGHLGRHIYEHRSVNAATSLAAGFLGQGAIIFATIWTNATSGFGQALLYTVVFGILGVAAAGRRVPAARPDHPGQARRAPDGADVPPGGLVSAAAQLAVAAIIVASIWP